MKIRLLFLSLVFAQCARETTIELPEEKPKVVVIGHFQPDDPFKVELTWSQSVYDTSDFYLIKEAEVTVSKNGVLYEKLQKRPNETYFRGRWNLPEMGQEYTISVRVRGQPFVDATSYIPEYIPLSPITMDPSQIIWTPIAGSDTILMSIPITLHPEQLPRENRFFAFQINCEKIVYDDHGHNTGSYFQPVFFDADARTQSLIHDISDAEPLILVSENFWNADHTSLSFRAVVPVKMSTEVPSQLFVEWRTLSEGFYRYHRSLHSQGTNDPLGDPDALYNNVRNGYGNFSGFSVGTQSILLN